ncbi:hypothetical protein BSKO_03172 [Bryopsis sp. KO-2023]|nr:hypothetical protein BSKO_03172 [Bryopsis sp. KO-2023]
MNVLLVGGAGFIGSHIAERLLSDGVHSVTVIDVVEEKIRGLLGHPNLRYLELDILEETEKLEDEIIDADVVISLAALVNPGVCLKKPVAVFELNFSANLRIAMMCLKHDKWLVQFSSGEVYGMSAASAFGTESNDMTYPLNEDESPLMMGPVRNTQWIYSCAKQMLERVLHAYGMERNLKCTVLRAFNFTGPGFDCNASSYPGENDNIFCRVMDSLLNGKRPITLTEGGSAVETYTDVDDGVDFVVKLLEDRGRSSYGEIFNVGHPGNDVSTEELARKLCDCFDRNFRQEGDPPRPKIVKKSSAGDCQGKGYCEGERRIPDNSKSKALLSWEPLHDIDRIVFRVLESGVRKFRNDQDGSGIRQKI